MNRQVVNYNAMIKINAKVLGYIAWTQALIGMIGSLIFSEIMDLLPCNLCWYQRIALYPLVFIIGVGILRRDQNYVWYALPLAITGWIIAVYHNLIYYQVIQPLHFICNDTVSCIVPFNIFGFISIPLLSLAAFTLIIICLYWSIKLSSHEQRS